LVDANNDTGHRDRIYRTRYGTAIATRPTHRAPWWLHLPAAWPRHDPNAMPTSRENSNGAFLFRSLPAVTRWLAPYILPEDPAPRMPRRMPGTPPLRTGGYT
jgi:hypothetical protein